MEYYNRALAIEQISAPNSLALATSYNNIGSVYNDQRNYASAMAFHQKAIAIEQAISPDSLGLATSYNNIGSVYKHLGDLSSAMEFYRKALAIRLVHSPDGLAVATSYHNLGYLSKEEGKDDLALELLSKCFVLYKKHLIPEHPRLIQIATTVAELSYNMDLIDQASEYADMLIAMDPRNKFGWNIKGKLLVKFDRLQEALRSFDQSISLDSGYADAIASRLEVLSELARTSSSVTVSDVEEALVAANSISTSSYDADYKKSLEERAKSIGDKDIQIVLPEPHLLPGSLEYQGELFAQRLEIVALKGRVQSVENKVDVLFGRISILEKSIKDSQQYRVSDVELMQRILINLKDCEDRIKKLYGNQSILQDEINVLKAEQAEWKKLKSYVKGFLTNADLRDHYSSLVSELEAVYIGAQALASGNIDQSTSTFNTSITGYLGTLASLIPLVGELVSKAIKDFGWMADLCDNCIDSRNLHRIRNLAADIQTFDTIANYVAVQLTLRYCDQIKDLQGSTVDQDWKSLIPTTLQEGLEGIMTALIKDDATKAKLLGRAHGLLIINYLQEDNAVLKLLDIDENDASIHHSREFKSHSALIAYKIVDDLVQRIDKVNSDQDGESDLDLPFVMSNFTSASSMKSLPNVAYLLRLLSPISKLLILILALLLLNYVKEMVGKYWVSV